MMTKHNLPFEIDSLRPCLITILGEKNAQRVLELMVQLGDGGKELVMILIEELVTAQEEIINARETIDYLRRRLYGQNRERFVDPDQGTLFGDEDPVVIVEVEEEEEEVVKKKRKKPRRAFRAPPAKVIVIDPEGDLSQLQKIGSESHRVIHFRPAQIIVYEYIRNKYVDPNNKEAGVLMGELPENVKGKRSRTIAH
ncbi:MAG: hypothetical protein OXF08_09465 [Bacteroidetes bacterium]|nr:hypothetical protein [Bacteroidota bacterium]